MIEFPPYASASVLICLLLFVVGVFAGVQSFFAWKRHLAQWNPKRPDETKLKSSDEKSQMVLLPLGSIVFIAVGILVVPTNLLETYRYRNLPIDAVESLTINRAPSEWETSSDQRRLTDHAIIAKGLGLLKICSSGVQQNHEHFEDGYRIKLDVKGDPSAEFYLSVFRRTNRSDWKTAVSIRGFDTVVDPMSCPSFQNWVRENIDPLFSAAKTGI